jgi:hypothetical protein
MSSVRRRVWSSADADADTDALDERQRDLRSDENCLDRPVSSG